MRILAASLCAAAWGNGVYGMVEAGQGGNAPLHVATPSLSKVLVLAAAFFPSLSSALFLPIDANGVGPGHPKWKGFVEMPVDPILKVSEQFEAIFRIEERKMMEAECARAVEELGNERDSVLERLDPLLKDKIVQLCRVD